eukprot:CAMPEP_0185838154 /NCGR_PEP_ID=MMETSP1353-20130828/12611_1 /TAXON_ID=1077150 /ORGANISM="Erythrolobus australicus, Strain CCMP3124" /LENGTH=125 /DNA_ID=CAMNT_0028537175 /DNA_START=106 /DNA_END=480 /DNA_ORIENTATION=+
MVAAEAASRDEPPRALFGGAMRLVLEHGFADVSGLRQVPDNQEVFADTASDRSVIVEILELVADDEIRDSGVESSPARFHFDAYIHDCEPLSAELCCIEPIGVTHSATERSALVRDARCAAAWLV